MKNLSVFLGLMFFFCNVHGSSFGVELLLPLIQPLWIAECVGQSGLNKRPPGTDEFFLKKKTASSGILVPPPVILFLKPTIL